LQKFNLRIVANILDNLMQPTFEQFERSSHINFYLRTVYVQKNHIHQQLNNKTYQLSVEWNLHLCSSNLIHNFAGTVTPRWNHFNVQLTTLETKLLRGTVTRTKFEFSHTPHGASENFLSVQMVSSSLNNWLWKNLCYKHHNIVEVDHVINVLEG
jgi:hypothetical protein